jgi:hypothetical protein
VTALGIEYTALRLVTQWLHQLVVICPDGDNDNGIMFTDLLKYVRFEVFTEVTMKNVVFLLKYVLKELHAVARVG